MTTRKDGGGRWRYRLGITLLAVSPLAGAGPECATTGLPQADLAAVKSADLAYAEAWLSNDKTAVLAILGTDPVIVPSGMDAITGRDAISAFWFPPGDAATAVNRFQLVQDEVCGSGDLGYARGTFELAFDYDGTSYESEGTYLTLLRRQSDGNWRIAYRTWNDHERSVTD